MISIKRILCPVDFFPASDKAASYAADLAADYGASILLLHIISPVIPVAHEYAINTDAIVKSVEQASVKQMSKLVTRLKDRGVALTSEVQTGSIHEVIKQVISAAKPDLIVIGTYARSGFERFFMGSVADWLTRNSPVPVLVVSEKQRKKARRRPEKRAA